MSTLTDLWDSASCKIVARVQYFHLMRIWSICIIHSARLFIEVVCNLEAFVFECPISQCCPINLMSILKMIMTKNLDCTLLDVVDCFLIPLWYNMFKKSVLEMLVIVFFLTRQIQTRGFPLNTILKLSYRLTFPDSSSVPNETNIDLLSSLIGGQHKGIFNICDYITWVFFGDHGHQGVLTAAGCDMCCSCVRPRASIVAPHWAPCERLHIYSQLSLWGRVGVTAGLSSMLHEGQHHRWGLIKQLSLKRQWSVSHPVLYPSEEFLQFKDRSASQSGDGVLERAWPVKQTLKHALGGIFSVGIPFFF